VEKAGIMRAGRPVVVSDPVPPKSLKQEAHRVGADLWQIGCDFNYAGDRQQWQWSGRRQRIHAMAYPALRGANQLLNASGVLAVFEALRDRVPITAQAARIGFAMVELPGRFQVVSGRPTLVLDVAHNPHAVSALVQNLEQMAYFPRTRAVFGVMADKDITAILRIMAGVVDHWHFTSLPVRRAATAAALQELHATAGLRGTGPVTVSVHLDPASALSAALDAADPADRIVVFGSFYTVGGVMADGLPRLSGRHSV
jgi:dihydrofolate synthase/folylpolyglutamate synthase